MKKKLIPFLLILLLLFFSACSVFNPSTQKNTPIPISNNSSTDSTRKRVPLYFGYTYQPQYLSVELHDFSDYAVEISLEEHAIRELISGPKNNSKELYGLFPEDTNVTVSSESTDQGKLSVVLSNHFWDSLQNEPNSSTDSNAKTTRQRMAIYSIVNTVIEIGNYSRVQIYINDPKTGSNNKIKLSDVGIRGDGYLDALSRNNDTILTPSNAVRGAFVLIQSNEWETLYFSTYQSIYQGLSSVSLYDFITQANSSQIILENFTVEDVASFPGNDSATVLTNFTLRGRDGHTIEYTLFPVTVHIQDCIWKIDFDSIISIIDKGV